MASWRLHMVLDTTRPPASGYITYEEYLQDEGENHCTEWVDGKVIDISMVSEEHDDLTLFLLRLLQIWKKSISQALSMPIHST